MTATKTRRPWDEMAGIANELVTLLADTCDRVNIVGSIRRKQADVADIELLVIPTIEVVNHDLFGEPLVTVNRLDERCQVLYGNGDLTHRLDKNGRPAWGARYKRVLYHGVPVDLFSCLNPDAWGVLEMIRTGSAGFSRSHVTQRRLGGQLPDDMYVSEGRLYRLQAGEYVPVPTPTEEAFFTAIGRPWIAPERRSA